MTEPKYKLRDLGQTPPRNPSDLSRENGFVCGIYGFPSSGKTTLLESLKNDEQNLPIAVFSMDNGGDVLQDDPGVVQIYQPRDWAHLDLMSKDVCNNPSPFKTIWIDPVTMVQEESHEHHRVHQVPSNNTRERQIKYGDSNWDVVGWHRNLMQCASQHGVNIFFVYWSTRPELVEGMDTQVKLKHFVLSPTVALKVEGLLDVIAYVERRPGLNPYPPVMTLDYNNGLIARRRLNPNNPLKKWKEVQQNPDLSEMVRAYHGEIVDGR